MAVDHIVIIIMIHTCTCDCYNSNIQYNIDMLTVSCYRVGWERTICRVLETETFLIL